LTGCAAASGRHRAAEGRSSNAVPDRRRGGGPAGLTAALALRRLGLEAAVFEQAQDYRLIGGGIVLHDNGQRVLAALGLLDSLRPRLQPCPVIAAELCGGRVLGAVDFGRFSPPVAPPAGDRGGRPRALLVRQRHRQGRLSPGRRCAVEWPRPPAGPARSHLADSMDDLTMCNAQLSCGVIPAKPLIVVGR